MTPFLIIVVSSSLTASSNVKPYWNPEQPPPCTKTRSFSSGLPSSSISCLTLDAAESEKTSGAGISTAAFIVRSRRKSARTDYRRGAGQRTCGSTCLGLGLHCFGTWARGRQLQARFASAFAWRVDQRAVDDGAVVHFQGAIVDIAGDLGFRLQLDQF